MLLEPSLSPEELPTFLAEAGKKRTYLTPEQTHEIDKINTRPPNNWQILKDGSRSKVGCHKLSDGREVVMKYYYPKNVFKKLNYRFTGSRCQRSWIAGQAFTRLSIPTPSPLHISEQLTHLGLLNSQSLIVTEKIEGIALKDLPSERYSPVAKQLSAIFGIFSQYHIAHGDLKATNIIITPRDRVSFIDLDATCFQLSGKSWDQARTYDRTRFRKNWVNNPEAASAFKDCID